MISAVHSTGALFGYTVTTPESLEEGLTAGISCACDQTLSPLNKSGEAIDSLVAVLFAFVSVFDKP